MSDRPVPEGEEGFAYFWGWVAREKLGEDLFRLIRSTPGLIDQSWMVEDIEKAVKDLLLGRVNQLRNLLEGWEILDRGMTKEIAVQLFNEFVAGCRTLEDFENRNFSKKNKDQQGKPRDQFPPHLSTNPILTKAPISELAANGGLPTTSTIYSTQSEEFFDQATNDMYYDKIFGDVKVFLKILQDNNRNPNMPAPKVHPMPYHPQMSQPTNFYHLPQHAQYTQQFQRVAYNPYPVAAPMQYVPQAQMQQVPMQQAQMPPQQQAQQQQQPAIYAPMMPSHYIPMAFPMAPMPMQGVQENMYAGQNYQQLYHGNHRGQQNNQQNNNNRGRNQRGKTGGRMNEKNVRNLNGYENVTTSSSSSSVTNNKPRSTVSEEETSTARLEETSEEAFPALEAQQPSTSEPSASSSVEDQVDAAEPETCAEVSEQLASTSENTDVVVTAPRKFSDVVSHSVSSSTLSTENSESSVTAGTTAVMEEPTTTESSSSADVTTALVVDTSEDTTSSAPPPPVSQKTIAEIVQQSLSATPSPSANGVKTSTQPSPAVKPYAAAVLSPATPSAQVDSTAPPAVPVSIPAAVPKNVSAASPSSTTPSANDTHKKTMKSQRKPSISYAQMLYPKSGSGSSNGSSYSPSSKSSQGSTAPAKPSTTPSEPTDWHTVKPKKAGDPSILSPPISVQPTPSPRERERAPEPVVISDDDDEEVLSDDPEAEKKRQKRRIKRQKMKEANRQQKQAEKELARQETLAKIDVEKIESSQKPEEAQPAAAPKLAFDRNDMAGRRKKRLELQRKTEFAESNNSTTTAPNPPPVPTPTVLPITAVSGNSIGASITAGQTAMAAYGLSGQFHRHRPSPFAIISPDGKATIPLFLPPQEGLRTNQENSNGTVLVEEVPADSTKTPKLPATNDTPTLRMEIDENARMVEQLLMFDSLEKMSILDMPESDKISIAKGLEDIKRMYVRVEKAGQLISYKTGSSKVSQKNEERLLSLTIKLLSNRVELNSTENSLVTEISNKIVGCSESFNYTNYLSALLDFTQIRANELPDGTNLRKNYEQSIVLTKVFMKRTKALFEKVSKYYNVIGLPEEVA